MLDLYELRDKVTFFGGIILIVFGILAYFEFFGFTIPLLSWMVGALFVVGGLFTIFDGFSVDDIMKFVYIILGIVITLLGVSAFYTIPVIGAIISASPISIVHYVVNAVVGVIMVAVALQS